ncbi:hypothetical protein [Helicobacter trogontum]|uniref:hypothetical protein n=1 Tax=Helicobacter trogontum TaxID=50960 RepID=UPI000CF04FF4|nr:hypothetical protein [Helicobacter trogontum]
MLKNKWIKSIVWVIGLIILVMILLKLDRLCFRYFNFSMPYVWLGGAFAIILLICAKRATSQGPKLTFIYIAIIPICVVISEIFFYYKLQQHVITQPHKILGYANTPSVSIPARFVVDNKVIYDVIYTHNKNGLRLTLNNNINSHVCLNIYGGSFAYGHGINNSKTITTFLQEKLPQYNVKNFGIAAAGAHQMLARLEFDLDSKELMQCYENIFIYEAIPHHIYRAKGVYKGPKYENINGDIVYQGVFSDEEQAPFWQIKKGILKDAINKPDNTKIKLSFIERMKNTLIKTKEQLAKSYTQEYLISHNKSSSKTSKDLLKDDVYKKGFASNLDIVKLDVSQDHIYFDIIRKINKILKDKYNAKLYVIVWDYDMHAQFLDRYDTIIQSTLKNDGIPFYTISEIIGNDYKEDLERVKNGDFEHFKYRLSRWDTHPNALANEKIAEFIATQIKNGTIKPSRLHNPNTTHDDPNKKGQE